jgi:hypothetical protein
MIKVFKLEGREYHMFDREGHREAAEAVGAVLARHLRKFQELAELKGNAMDQTLAVLNAEAYAQLFYDLGGIPEDETIRPALDSSGMLRAVDTYLHSLRVVVTPLVYVALKRKPIQRKRRSKGPGTASVVYSPEESGGVMR